MLQRCPRCRIYVEPSVEAGSPLPRCRSCATILERPVETEAAPKCDLDHVPTSRMIVIQKS